MVAKKNILSQWCGRELTHNKWCEKNVFHIYLRPFSTFHITDTGEMQVNNKCNLYGCISLRLPLIKDALNPKLNPTMAVCRFWNHFQTELPLHRPDWEKFLQQQQTSRQEPDVPETEPHRQSYCVSS